MRLFVALDLPGDLVLPDPPDPPWRPVPAANRHVTLVFIGDADTAPALAEAPPRAVLRVTRPLLLPPRRPRVRAVGLKDTSGELTAYQARLARALDRVEDRPWLPHVTIGRTRERVRREAAVPEVAPQVFTPPSATLYASRGGRYEALVTLPAA